ncbi:hypothetical protein C0995_012999, partial [Termitomyces sp. Mi166
MYRIRYSSFQGQVQANGYTPFNANGHEVNDRPSSRQNRSSSYIAEKPLPLPYDHQHPPYNLASQSQQPDSHTYYIPPAHAISDSEPFPASSSYAPHQPNKQRHVLPRRITEENLHRRTSTDEEADGDGGSSADEAEPEVRAIDNPRYVPSEPTAPSSSHGHSPFKFNRQSVSSGMGEQPQPQPQTPSPRKEKGKGLLGGKGSTSDSTTKRSPTGGSGSGSGFFGSLKGLFGGGGSTGSRASSPAPAFYEAPVSVDVGKSGGLFGGKRGKGRGKEWETRTERNLRDIEREMRVPTRSPAVRAPTPGAEVAVEGGGGAYGHMRES